MKQLRMIGAAVVAGVVLILLGACRRAIAPEEAASENVTSSDGVRSQVGAFVPRAIGSASAANQPAWITDLTIADLDRDGRLDVVACDARTNRIVWLRQTEGLEFVEQPIGETIAGPAHVEVLDFDDDGDQDVLVAGMGVVPPSTERTGTVTILENDGEQRFAMRTLLERTHRVTDVRAADLNGDGRRDLAIAQFGYYEGQVQWLQNRGEWKFSEHPLIDLSGAVHAPIVDLNGDAQPDIVALISQEWEEVWGFENRGGGAFVGRILHGSTNRDYGSSGLSVADLNRDGHADLVYTNGDGFDYATPGSRPWHGVQWLQNDGRGNFRFRRIGDFAGAYSPCVVDLDADGDNDVVAVSAFNDWASREAASLVYFENDGREGFARHVLAHEPTHLVVAKAADLDNDGAVEIVTGSFAFYPPLDRAGRITLWRRAIKP